MSNLLSDNDIHYLSGILYLVAGNSDIVLGERIYHEPSDSKRDVDIICLSVGSVGLIGAEVKHEARKLHTGEVEQLCTKLSNMPSIKRKYIISSSGYSEPAIKTAKFYNVECMTLVKGEMPPFVKVDNKEIFYQKWSQDHPICDFHPVGEVPIEFDKYLKSSTTIIWHSDKNKTSTAQELVDRVTKCLTPRHRFLPVGIHEVVIPIHLFDDPALVLNGVNFPIDSIIAKGTIEVTKEDISLEQSRYITDQDNKIFAGAAIVEWQGNLLGIAASPDASKLQAFMLPPSMRSTRPTKFNLTDFIRQN